MDDINAGYERLAELQVHCDLNRVLKLILFIGRYLITDLFG